MGLNYYVIQFIPSEPTYIEYHKKTGDTPIQYCLHKLENIVKDNDEEIINIQTENHVIGEAHRFDYPVNPPYEAFNMIAYTRKKEIMNKNLITCKTIKPPYQNGDVYWNSCFGDLWIVEGTNLIKINNGYTIEIDQPLDFEYVGHLDVETKVNNE